MNIPTVQPRSDPELPMKWWPEFHKGIPKLPSQQQPPRSRNICAFQPPNKTATPTRARPINTMAEPAANRLIPTYCAHFCPTTKSKATNRKLDTRKAICGREKMRNGTAAGRQDKKTSQKQATAP